MGELDRQAIEEKFQVHLFGGEYIEWCGQGKSVDNGAPPLFFAIIWTGFSLLWTVIAYLGGGGVFALFGLPFIAIGVILFVKIFKGGDKEYYALTNMRIFLLRGNDVRAEYYDRITDARVYPGVKKGVTVVRVTADMTSAFSSGEEVFCDICVNDTMDAEYLCRQILSYKEKYIAEKR
ncbi:MAG: hypothetical protein ACI4JF_01575 [Oscillospiraceae bacterium]